MRNRNKSLLKRKEEKRGKFQKRSIDRMMGVLRRKRLGPLGG